MVLGTSTACSGTEDLHIQGVYGIPVAYIAWYGIPYMASLDGVPQDVPLHVTM